MEDIEDICNSSEFIAPEPLDPNKHNIIKVIGVGGGGGNAVGHMYKQGIKDVRFVVCNTDKQALNNSPVPDRVLLGHTGLGAGNDPARAKADAEESIDAINAMFDQHTKMVFITAGMGGGTGTGAAPIVAKAAKDHGVLTIGIVTIPFLFEGLKKIAKAMAGADEMGKYVDALLLINNENLINIYPDLDFDSAFAKADDTLSTAARSISELITTCDTRINLDFNDVDATLRDGGSAIISCGFGEGPDRVQKAIDDALKSPLLSNGNILGSKRLLFNLYISRTAENMFNIGEMSAFTNFVTSIEDVDVIYGVAYDDSLGDKVKVTILASGFQFDKLLPNQPDNGDDKSEQPEKNTIIKSIANQYGTDAAATVITATAKNMYVVLTPEQLDNDSIIEALEKYPAFSRTKEEKAEIVSMTNNGAASSTPTPTPSTPEQSETIVFD